MSPAPRQRSSFEKRWRRDPSFGEAIAALPLRLAGGCYRAALAIRNRWWRRMARAAGVPVISVGNLTVGGNAKTPFTVFLATRLQNYGLKVAIVSRGYGGTRSRRRATLVAIDGKLNISPEASGDEPAMIARGFSGPIAIGRRRINAIEMLQHHGPLDVVILDDGFQHTRLKRNLDLVLVSENRGFGNGRMLPAGPMREPLGALNRADAVIMISSGRGTSGTIRAWEMKRIMTRPVFHVRLHPRCLVHPEHGEWRETAAILAGRRVLAVSGLADPSGFHAMVREIDGDLVGVLEYPDHHSYTAEDWQEISAAARDVDMVITTEKDLIKLERFPFARDSLYALRLEVSIVEKEAGAFDEMIFSRIGISLRPESTSGEVSRNAG